MRAAQQAVQDAERPFPRADQDSVPPEGLDSRHNQIIGGSTPTAVRINGLELGNWRMLFQKDR